MASMPLELTSSSMSSSRCWRRRPLEELEETRPSEGRRACFFHVKKRWFKRNGRNGNCPSLCREWRNISYSNMIKLQAVYHWSLTKVDVDISQEGSEKTTNIVIVIIRWFLFCPWISQHELRVTVSLSARRTRHSRLGASTRIAAVNWICVFTSPRTKKHQQKPTRR